MKKKHIVLKVIVCIVCILIVLTVGYKMHMHYDIEEHEFYDVDTMKSEGRDFSASSVVYMTKDISPEGLRRVYEALNV